jgi:hypothetical protein
VITYGLSLQAIGYIYSILLYNCGPLGPLSIVSSVNIYKSTKLPGNRGPQELYEVNIFSLILL